MFDQNSLLHTAAEAVTKASAVTRAVQADLDRIRMMTKDDRSPVTVADFAAQAIVALTLQESLGEVVMVGEETSAELRDDSKLALRAAVTQAIQTAWPDADSQQALDAIDLGNHDASGERYWTLDPVDGTKGFLRGGQYAISLALIEAHEVVLGVLGCPNLAADFSRPFDDPDPVGTLFAAARGSGAWRASLHNTVDFQKISASDNADISAMRVCESVESGHSKQDDTARIVDFLSVAGTPARLDSQCKYAVVARGQADAYFRLPTIAGYVEKIWDHAAGLIVAEEAGALVSDIFGHPLDFSHGTTLAANTGVVCASAPFHTRIIDAIERLGIGR